MATSTIWIRTTKPGTVCTILGQGKKVHKIPVEVVKDARVKDLLNQGLVIEIPVEEADRIFAERAATTSNLNDEVTKNTEGKTAFNTAKTDGNEDGNPDGDGEDGRECRARLAGHTMKELTGYAQLLGATATDLARLNKKKLVQWLIDHGACQQDNYCGNPSNEMHLLLMNMSVPGEELQNALTGFIRWMEANEDPNLDNMVAARRAWYTAGNANTIPEYCTVMAKMVEYDWNPSKTL